jgi:hypothetical protein
MSEKKKTETEGALLDEQGLAALLETVPLESVTLEASDPSGGVVGHYVASPQETVGAVLGALVEQGGLPGEGTYGLYAEGPQGAVRLDPGRTVGENLADHGLDTGTLRCVLAPELQGNI